MEEKKNEELLMVKEDFKEITPLTKDENKENTSLTKDEKNEKKNLVDIIKDLSDNLNRDEEESINDIYSEYLNNEDVTKRYIADNTGRICLIIMFYVLSPLFSMINLIAIFQSIHMLKTLFEIIKNSISYYIASFKNEEKETFSIETFNDTYNFYNILLKRTLEESFDFNLMMLTSFLGEILFKARGLTFTIGIFNILINGASFFLLYSFNFRDYNNENNNFTILQILYLIGCYILLYIGVGASALLSQQIIVDSNKKYNDYLIILKKKEEEERIKKKKPKEN